MKKQLAYFNANLAILFLGIEDIYQVINQQKAIGLLTFQAELLQSSTS